MRGLGVLPALLAAATAGSRHGLLGAPSAGINMAASDMLIVGTLDGEVHAVSGASGELLWSMSTGGRIISSSKLAMLEAAAAAQQKGGAAAGSGGDLGQHAPNQSGQYDRHGAVDETWSLGAGVADDASRQWPVLPPLPSPTFASAPPTGPPASRPPPADCVSRAVASELLPPPPPRTPRAAAPVMVAPPTADASAGERSGVGFGGRAAPPPPSPPPLPRRRSLLPPEKLRPEFRSWADRPPRNEHEQGEHQHQHQRQHQHQHQQRALAEGAEAAAAAEAEAAEAAAVEAAEGLEIDELLVVPGLDGSLYVLGEEGEAHPLTDYTVQVSASPGRGDPGWGRGEGGACPGRGRTCGLPPPDSPTASFAGSAVSGRIWSLSPPSSLRACSSARRQYACTPSTPPPAPPTTTKIRARPPAPTPRVPWRSPQGRTQKHSEALRSNRQHSGALSRPTPSSSEGM